MAEIRVVPQLWIHQFLVGGVVQGVAPTGAAMVDSEETLDRGQRRLWSALTDGGLFELPAALGCGWRFHRLLWALPGATKVDVYARDEATFDYQLLTSTATSGAFDVRDPQILLIPGWSLRVVATFAAGLTAAGRIVVEGQQALWDANLFRVARRVGREDRVT